MSATSSLEDLPVEILQVILEDSVDAELLERKEYKPHRSLQVLLASIHTSSRLRSIAWNYKPLWRRVAGAIPSSLLETGRFHQILSFCSERTGATLDQVSFALSDRYVDWSFWDGIILSMAVVYDPPASHLRALRMPSSIQDTSSLMPKRKGWKKRAAKYHQMQQLARGSFRVLLRHWATHPGLDHLEAHLHDLMYDSPTTISVASPQRLCLILRGLKLVPFAEFWDKLCLRLEHLCFLTSEVRMEPIRYPLDSMLQRAQNNLTSLEVHTCISGCFISIRLPSLLKLRIQLWGSSKHHSSSGSLWDCPALRILDVPASFLDRISAPRAVMVALTLRRSSDDQKILRKLCQWLQLDSLVLHLSREKIRAQEAKQLIRVILTALNPALRDEGYCPILSRFAITTMLPEWYKAPYTTSLADLSDRAWWKKATRSGGYTDFRPSIDYNLSAMIIERKKRSRRAALDQSNPYRALDLIRIIGCETPPDWRTRVGEVRTEEPEGSESGDDAEA